MATAPGSRGPPRLAPGWLASARRDGAYDRPDQSRIAQRQKTCGQRSAGSDNWLLARQIHGPLHKTLRARMRGMTDMLVVRKVRMALAAPQQDHRAYSHQGGGDQNDNSGSAGGGQGVLKRRVDRKTERYDQRSGGAQDQPEPRRNPSPPLEDAPAH